MVIALNPEQEHVVGQAIEVGLIKKAEDAVELGMGTIRQRLEVANGPANSIPYEEWSRRLHAWVDMHATDGPPLSDEAMSRQSIYGDRGL